MTTNVENSDSASLQDPPHSLALRGALIGAIVGLIPVWLIVGGAYDPNVTDHSPIFPAAVAITCGFACFVFFVFVVIGGMNGTFMKR